MLKMRYFLKKKIAKFWGSDLRLLQSYPHHNCTATKRSNFVAHKKPILIWKNWSDFSAPSACDIASSLHLVWRRHWSSP